ncbi:MAG: glycosyltransferase family 87 protein [Candidatus Thorarchaeota archaeon]
MNGEREYPVHKYFIYLFVIITVLFVILRVLLYFFDISTWIKETKDIDFKILLEGMDNGLVHFYDPISISVWPPYYLYFWYFLFFPIYILPPQGLISIYVWDVLRLILTILVVKESSKLFKSKKDLLIFYIFGIVGYSIDAYYNNVNFIIVVLLFYSFVFLEKDQKWISGILFTFSTFKITAILFLPVLIIIRKIKLKDLIYYLIPFALICIPYMIFPEYFFQMITNWGHSDAEIQGFLIIDSIIWKALQPSHLMFIALLLIIFLENVKDEKRRKIYRIILVSFITLYYVYLTTIVYLIPVFLA